MESRGAREAPGVNFPVRGESADMRYSLIVALIAALQGAAGVSLAGRLLGWRKGEAWTIGWLLQTKALIMIIFANILLDKQVITPTTFTALLLMAVGSTMLTKPFATPLIAKLGGRVKAEA